jgi:phosphatidylinositol-bisphosphatase
MLDQLNLERKEGRAFVGFEEGVINFAPTYKYQPGTDV